MAKYIYPECKTVDFIEERHGITVADPHKWMRNAKDPEVLDFTARQNAFTDAYFNTEKVRARMAELKTEKLPSLPGSIVPTKDGYLAMVDEDANHIPTFYSKELKVTGVLKEIPALKDVQYISVKPSPRDERYMGIMYLAPGASRLSVGVADMESLEVLKAVDGLFSFTWGGDGRIYYANTVFNSKTMESTANFYSFDPVTREEKLVLVDEKYSIFGILHTSKDGKYVMCEEARDYAHANWVAFNTETGEIHPIDSEPHEWVYADSVNNEHYFINLSNCAHGELIAVNNCGDVRTVMAESRDYVLNGAFTVDGSFFVTAYKDVSGRLIDVNTAREIPLPSLFGNIACECAENSGAILRFESFTEAPCLLFFDGKEVKPLLSTGNIDASDIVVEQFFAPSVGDGEMIPYYMVRHKDAKPDGTAHVYMYAYGGYNVPEPPACTERISGVNVVKWVRKGGIFIQCNLRGGSEYGAPWHEAGMLLKKKNCFYDFIGVAEQLIKEGWAVKGRIGCVGCSNGGLLMSALVTMRPDLWGCIIDSVPQTDAIHIADEDRGPMYVTEYGNPYDNREILEYLLSYSPYHNVKAVDYPPVYVQTGELDNNVPPYHGKKFAARLQAMNTSDNPILLRVLAEGSHDRGHGEAYWQTISEMQLFLEEHMGMDQ